MIVKITPPAEMLELIKQRGESIRDAEALAAQAAKMLKNSQVALWGLISGEYPEISPDGLRASYDHATGIITVHGTNSEVVAMMERISTANEKAEIAKTLILMD